MRIREANAADLNSKSLEDIQELMNTGLAAEGADQRFDPERFYDFWAIILSSRKGAMFFLEDDNSCIVGLISGLVNEDPTTGQRLAAHVNWRVSPVRKGGGLALLSALEGWARSVGAEALTVHVPSLKLAARLDSKYRMQGMVFMKSLKE